MPKRMVIDDLREAHPGKWRFDMDARVWVHESGRWVHAVAACVPQYEGDDQTFETTYRWVDTDEPAITRRRQWSTREQKPPPGVPAFSLPTKPPRRAETDLELIFVRGREESWPGTHAKIMAGRWIVKGKHLASGMWVTVRTPNGPARVKVTDLIAEWEDGTIEAYCDQERSDGGVSKLNNCEGCGAPIPRGGYCEACKKRAEPEDPAYTEDAAWEAFEHADGYGDDDDDDAEDGD